MAVNVMAWVWTLDIPATDKLVLLAIADNANEDGLAWPSRRRLSGKTSLSERSLARIVRRLEDDGFLQVKRGTGKAVTNYQITKPGRGDTVAPQDPAGVTEMHPRGDTVAPPIEEEPSGNHQDPPPTPQPEPQQPARPPAADQAAQEVVRVFEAWKTSTSRNGRTVLSPERRRVILKALKSHGLEDTLYAVDGWRFSPHHRGENSTRTVYNDLGLLLRNAGQVEKFAALGRRHAPHTIEHRNTVDRIDWSKVTPEEMEDW